MELRANTIANISYMFRPKTQTNMQTKQQTNKRPVINKPTTSHTHTKYATRADTHTNEHTNEQTNKPTWERNKHDQPRHILKLNGRRPPLIWRCLRTHFAILRLAVPQTDSNAMAHTTWAHMLTPPTSTYGPSTYGVGTYGGHITRHNLK